MIYPATLILATIVFNAAAGLGAPVRITQSQHVSRADADDIAARSTIIDVPARVRSVASDPVDARSDTASENDIRDTSSQPLEARDSLPEVDRLVRRFPRAHYARFYERQSNQPEARAPSPEPEAAQLERRYPRRALYERHESAPVEARSESVETPELERRLPRRGLYERYVKRSTPPAPEQPIAREPTPEQAEPVYRRFPRKVYAEAADMQKRQEEPAATPAETPAATETPAGQPTAAGETPAATAEGAVPTGDASASASAPAATGEATATASASASGAATATASASTTTAIIAPSTPLTSGNPGTPSNLEGLIRNITANADDGFQEGTTIKETTLLVNKITHISGSKDKPAQNIVESKVLATTVTATPSSPSATATSSAAPSAAVTGAPEVATQAGESSSAAATETPAATATSAPEAQPTNTGEAAPGGDASAGAARRALGTGNLRARNIGFSGAAYASYAKRNVN